MRIGVLGTTVASDSSGPVNLGGPKQRALLATLALHRGRAVAVDTLADVVWNGTPPPGVSGTMQGYVAGLRRVLEPGRTARGGGTLLVTEQPGYALRLPEQDLDATAFEAAVASAHTTVAPLADALCRGRALPPGAPDAGGLDALHRALDEALGLWRGVPYADLGDAPAAEAERARLEELRLLASENHAALGILLGLHATVAADLDSLTRQHPLRERAWALRALALAGSGRQADALAVLRQVRDVLDDELGLEPGPELRAVQTAVLRQETPTATTPAPAPVPAPAPAAPDEHAPLPFPTLWGWSLAGRDDELAAMKALVDRTVAGTGGAPAFAALTGDPGIGKSRLAIEAATYAAEQGMTIAWGRCSQDDGAPALWPWATVLERLGSELPSGGSVDDDGGAAFRAWEAVVERVLAAATAGPLMLVIDDLHWADTSSLRVLRLLTEAAVAEGAGPRLLVVTTWREHPLPEGALAEVADALARQHALRIQLRGISAEATAQVFGQISEAAPTETETEALRRRTEGNPFFLVEYARLARDRGDLGALLSEAQPPAAVHEVLSRRIATLQPETRDLLQSASVLGRIFELGTLATTTGRDEDAVLDALDPALAAGLVDEDGVDRFRFTHALVRDTVLSSLPASRQARVHARAAAALDGRAGHETETARHWLAAGPRHLGDAWPAAQAAARKATEVFAYVEALEMLEHALRAQDADPGSDDYARFDLLTDLAHVLRRAGRWLELRGVTHEAVEVADELGDLQLLAVAGAMTSTGALWQASAHAEVDPFLVAALRQALDRLPAGDDPARCRTMLALAGEIYYGSTPQEREALCEEAVAMARRIGDPALTLSACLNAAIAVWRGGTAQWRLELTTEAVAIARELGDGISLASALTLQATAAGELGEIALMDEATAAARAEADRLRHVYAQLVLDSLEVSWSAMRGRFEEVEKLIGHMQAVGDIVSITGYEESVAGATLMLLLWQGRDEELAAAMLAMEGNTFLPIATSIVAMQCRTGSVDAARAWYDAHREDVDVAMASDTWFSPMAWSMGAEAACYLDEPELAAAAYEKLIHLSGRPAGAGSGSAIGPVDMFLAMAAHATGQDDLATGHADRAVELCGAWNVPLAADWVRRERERFGF